MREAQPDLRQVVELVTAVVAPTTLITALGLYFGVKFQEARAAPFGIDVSLLGYSTQDYLLRSTDAVIPVLLVLALGGLVALQSHVMFSRTLAARDSTGLRWAVRVAAVVGAGALTLGVLAVFRPLPFRTPFLFRPVTIGLGMSLVAYSMYVSRKLRGTGNEARLPATLIAVLVVLVVLMSLFLGTAEYAQALGRGKAEQLIGQLDRRPYVVLFSKERLHLDGRGVEETVLEGADASLRYRYGGLRLLVKSGGNYFLLPKGWTGADGMAIVLPDDGSMRIQVSPRAPA